MSSFRSVAAFTGLPSRFYHQSCFRSSAAERLFTNHHTLRFGSPISMYMMQTNLKGIHMEAPDIMGLANGGEIHDGLDFSSNDDRGYSFGISSVKFSTDGRSTAKLSVSFPLEAGLQSKGTQGGGVTNSKTLNDDHNEANTEYKATDMGDGTNIVGAQKMDPAPGLSMWL